MPDPFAILRQGIQPVYQPMALPTAQPFSGWAGQGAVPVVAPVHPQTLRPTTFGTPASNFSTPFNDPSYDQLEMDAGTKYGVPPQLIKAIRIHGERSNNGQVSSKGARTPYQFIPATRDAFLKKYGVDAWAGPQQAAEAAALHLRDDFQKYGSWQAAVAGYNGGAHAAQNVAVGKAPGNAETDGYLQRVMGAMGDASGLPTGFNAALYSPGLAGYDKAMQTAMQPMHAQFNPGPMPEAPAAIDAPTKDFKAQDAILAEMAPVAPTAEDGHNLQRRRLWQGAAQALAGLDEGAGVGSILAKVGAGMLGGRLSADDEIQAKTDKYDADMQAYRGLLFNQEGNKAQAKFEEATAEAQSAHERAVGLWQVNYQNWQQNNKMEFDGTGINVRTQAKDGTITTTRTPIAALVLPALLIGKAGAEIGVANDQNNVSVGVASTLRSAVIGTAVQLAGNSVLQSEQTAAEGTTGTLAATAILATEAVTSGQAEQVVGTDAWKASQQLANEHAGIQHGVAPTKEQEDLRTQFLVGALMQDIDETPGSKEKFDAIAPRLSGLHGATARSTTTTKAGNTTTRVVN